MLTYPVGLLAPKIGSSPIPRDGLIGEWLFSGNANDTSGNGNDGIVTGAILTTNRHDTPDSAYLFSDISNHNILLNSTINEQSIMSVSWWANLNTLISGGRYCFLSNGGVSTRNYFAYLFMYASPTTDKMFNNSGDGASIMDAGDDIIVIDNWYNFVIIRNDPDLLLYINGVLFSNVPRLTRDLSDIQYFGIRNDSGVLGNGILGKMDDIRIYNRVLTQEEITALYNE